MSLGQEYRQEHLYITDQCAVSYFFRVLKTGNIEFVLFILKDGEEIVKFDGEGGNGPYHAHLKGNPKVNLCQLLPNLDEQINIVISSLKSGPVLNCLARELRLKKNKWLAELSELEKEIEENKVAYYINSKNISIHVPTLRLKAKINSLSFCNKL